MALLQKSGLQALRFARDSVQVEMFSGRRFVHKGWARPCQICQLHFMDRCEGSQRDMSWDAKRRHSVAAVVVEIQFRPLAGLALPRFRREDLSLRGWNWQRRSWRDQPGDSTDAPHENA